MYNTPDLLLVFFLILYLRSDSMIQNTLRNVSYGFLCGFIGALAYFTKSFAFPFFLSTFFDV